MGSGSSKRHKKERQKQNSQNQRKLGKKRRDKKRSDENSKGDNSQNEQGEVNLSDMKEDLEPVQAASIVPSKDTRGRLASLVDRFLRGEAAAVFTIVASIIGFAGVTGGISGWLGGASAVGYSDLKEQLTDQARRLESEFQSAMTVYLNNTFKPQANQILTVLSGAAQGFQNQVTPNGVVQSQPAESDRPKAIFVVLPPEERGAAAATSRDMWDGIVRAFGDEGIGIPSANGFEYIPFVRIEDGPDGESTVRRAESTRSRIRVSSCAWARREHES